MALRLDIGGEVLLIEAAAEVLAAVEQRYGRFAVMRPARMPIEIVVQERPGGFRPTYERPVDGAPLLLTDDVITFDGPVRGRFEVARRRGYVEDVTGLGPVDLLVRVALSVCLPQDGALLLHAAVLPRASGEGLALCGASGSGKSTAARFFGGACDELAVLSPMADGVEILSTPYWQGRPFRARCQEIVCLERGATPGLRTPGGAEALRVLMRHVIHHASIEEIERSTLSVAAGICAQVGVTVATCPAGERFLPFLAAHLEEPAGVR